MDTRSIVGLLGFVGACFLAAMSGALFRPGEWYERLAKPWWVPPRWLFGPAWSILYLMIAISGWLVWRQTAFAGAATAFVVYFFSLTINAAWSACFFGLRRIDLGMADIVLLWFSIAATIFFFRPINSNAALLLLPYLAWVTFAGALNFAIWRMNRSPSRN